MRPGELVALHSNDVYPTNGDGTLPFHQHSDLYYLTGVAQEETVLLLFPGAVAEEDREILFVKETNETIAIWEGEKLSKERAREVSGIRRVEWLQTFETHFHRLALQAEALVLSTNEHPRAAVEVATRNDRFVRRCRERYPLHRYERLAPRMQRLRCVKDPLEIDVIEKACAITEAGFRRALGFIRPGVGEWEIEAEFLHEFVRRGSRGFAYAPIIGSGSNACVLHYVANDRRCQAGELLLMDVAAEYAGWNSDMTRAVPVDGKFTARQKEVYQAVLRVMRGADGLLRPGVKPADYQRQVLELMEKELVDLGLFSMGDAKKQGPEKSLVKKYFMHGTSHHLGLEVHDISPHAEAFAAGMVMTIEPGIYIREEGLGIRLENNVVIGEERNHDLMAGIPIEAEEIEELMRPKRIR